MNISILDIIEGTTVDGPGFRTTIYSAGCTHNCKGCHNQQSWDIHSGVSRSIESILEVALSNEFADITFSGGDPMLQVEAFTELARLIKLHSQKSIWCYTGYTYETVRGHAKMSKLLPYIDVLVDGRFVEALKDETLLFKGSKNQRLINVQASIEKGDIVLYNYNPYPMGMVV